VQLSSEFRACASSGESGAINPLQGGARLKIAVALVQLINKSYIPPRASQFHTPQFRKEVPGANSGDVTMRVQSVLVAFALSAPLTGLWAADTPDPNSLPKVSCSDFKYSQDFLAKYPKAPAACLEGRTYKGVNYAKFNAKVTKVTSSDVTVQVLNTAGSPITPLTIKPADQKAFILVNGKQTQITDLSQGDSVTFWVPQSRMRVDALPSQSHWIVLAQAPSAN
jgi:hypothetical protein